MMAKEVKKDKRGGLLRSNALFGSEEDATLALGASAPGLRLGFGDVACAYFQAKARSRAHVDLSMEDFEEGKCGLLKKATYETRDTGQNEEMEYGEMMVDAGLRQGVHSACVFYREQKNIQVVVVYGDDFTTLGASKSLDWFRRVAQQRMEVKLKKRLERGKPGSERILNRIAMVTDQGVGVRGGREAC